MNLLKLIFLFLGAAVCICSSCSDSDRQYQRRIDEAEKLMQVNGDSAQSILDAIEVTDIKSDTLRNKLIFLKAYGHFRQNRSMVSDSLITYAHDYYRGKDKVKAVRSGMTLAWYKFWVGDTEGAMTMLDSLTRLADVPDSVMAQTLKTRIMLGISEYQGNEEIALAKRLNDLETDTARKIEAKFMLLSAYEYSDKLDSALMLANEIIDYARDNKLGELHFQLMLERAQLLCESGKNAESKEDIDYIFEHAGEENGAADYLHMVYAMNALNTGNTTVASREIEIADSLAKVLRPEDETYYRSYSNLIHTLIDFK